MEFGRLAVVAWVLLLFAAVAATFLPTSPGGAECGTWVAPEWDDESTEQLLDRARGLAGNEVDAGVAGEASGLGASIMESKRLCDDALGTRRTVSLVLLGAAVLVPICVLFVGAGRREPGS